MDKKLCSICGETEDISALKEGVCTMCRRCLELHNMMVQLPKFEEVPELVDKLIHGIQTGQITGQVLEDIKSFLVDTITKSLPK